MLANDISPDQTPHDVASDLGPFMGGLRDLTE